MREPRPDWSPLGVNFKILDEHPHLFLYSSPFHPGGLAIVVSCRTGLCLTAAPYAEARLREMSQSFEERLTAGRGVMKRHRCIGF